LVSGNGWGGVDVRTDANGRDAGELQRSDADPFLALPPGPRNDLRPGRRYIVTGCAGFIGSHLTEALSSLGCSVLGVDAFTDNYPREIKERNLNRCFRVGDVGFAELDLATDGLEALLDGVAGVFHLAGRPGVRTSWGSTFESYLSDNVHATQRIFEAAVHHGIKVVYASSSSVYGDAEAYPLQEDAKPLPVSPYGVSKLACEALASTYTRSLGLDAVGLRYFSVYGPRQRPDMAFAEVFDCLGRKRPFRLFGNGHQSRDFTFVADVVEATLAAMRCKTSNPVYNVGGGSETSMLDALSLCEEVAGERLEVVHDGAGTGDARRTLADFGQAEADLGWTPSTSLETGLRAQAESAAAARGDRSPAVAEAA
jgi:UDP-glucuronate 4-epimerase